MVGGNIIGSDSIHQITAPASIQHPSYNGLQQGGSCHNAHVDYAVYRAGQVDRYGLFRKYKTDEK